MVDRRRWWLRWRVRVRSACEGGPRKRVGGKQKRAYRDAAPDPEISLGPMSLDRYLPRSQRAACYAAIMAPVNEPSGECG